MAHKSRGVITINEFILYAYTFCSRAERVLWTLRELELPHKVIRLDITKGETQTEEFAKLNPSRKIPVVVHGDEVLTESMAIMEYLNDISDNSPLIPREAKQAYTYRKIVHYGATEIEPYLWVGEQDSRLKGLYHWPQGSYDSAIKLAKENISLAWNWFANNQYIAGDKFTLADIYYYSLITWAKAHQIDHPKVVSDYLRMLESRPAFPAEISLK